MARINWLFEDEKGENLNRYIATNVETGEKITFDLLRGGNIEVVGTPLNAEKLNELINAINDKVIYIHHIQFEGQYGTLNFQITSKDSAAFTGTSITSTINAIKYGLGRALGNNVIIMASGVATISGDTIIITGCFADDKLYVVYYSMNNKIIETLDIQTLSWNAVSDDVQTVMI